MVRIERRGFMIGSGRRFGGAALCFFLVIGSTNLLYAQLQNVDDLVSSSFTGLRFDRRARTFNSAATLTNISGIPVSGPLQLVITQTDPASVTLVNASGTTSDGLPFIVVPVDGGPLTPGGEITPILLRFSNPTRSAFTFATSVLGVPGSGEPPSPLDVAITSPSHLSLFNVTQVSVTGTVDDPTASVTVNGISAGVGASFSVVVPLSEGNNTITAVAANAAGASGTASIQLTRDSTPPSLTFDSPEDGFVSHTSTVTLTGMINDIVVGTVNGDQASVLINGQAAEVGNRSFLLSNFELSLGPNTIVAMGTDNAGNTGSAEITVFFEEPSIGEPFIRLISGNGQARAIGSLLLEPLVVQLVNGAWDPDPGKTVIFEVTESNGTLSNSPAEVRSIAVTTDDQGLARANWTLGTRAGAGNNLVEATAVGFEGTAIFTANATVGLPGQINVDSGSMQNGVTEQTLAKPFVAIVTDAGHNRLPQVPVTFTVTRGEGNFEGFSATTVLTDSDGRALATLSLGAEPGFDNNVVEATFAGNLGFPAVFSASGKLPGDPAATRISGVVLDNSNVPVPGVTISLENTTISVETDEEGQFFIQPAPVGVVHLIANGTTASRPGTWPTLEFEQVTIPGQNNTLGMPIFLLPLDTANELCVSPTDGGTLTLPAVPGFSLSIAPNTATFPDGSRSGCVNVTVVHGDKVPMVPNFGQQPRFIVTIQPAGVHFDPPAPLTIPNLDGLGPGQVTELYSFDHDLGQFVSIGPGSVSEDGLVIASDPGVGIIKGGWHCGGDPAASGTVANCPECQICKTTSCVANDSQTPAQVTGNCMKEICSGGSVSSKVDDTDNARRRRP